jgi:hypothetical protein
LAPAVIFKIIHGTKKERKKAEIFPPRVSSVDSINYGKTITKTKRIFGL